MLSHTLRGWRDRPYRAMNCLPRTRPHVFRHRVVELTDLRLLDIYANHHNLRYLNI